MNDDRGPFGDPRDPELGRLLRRALDPGEQAAFVGRVLARFAHPRPAAWEVLASWARPGIAAAALAAAVAGAFVGRAVASPRSPFDHVLASAAGADTVPAVALARADAPPDPAVLVGVSLEP